MARGMPVVTRDAVEKALAEATLLAGRGDVRTDLDSFAYHHANVFYTDEDLPEISMFFRVCYSALQLSGDVPELSAPSLNEALQRIFREAGEPVGDYLVPFGRGEYFWMNVPEEKRHVLLEANCFWDRKPQLERDNPEYLTLLGGLASVYSKRAERLPIQERRDQRRRVLAPRPLMAGMIVYTAMEIELEGEESV